MIFCFNHEWEVILAIALCSAAISFTITTTSMFTWLRELVSRMHPKLEELIHCPWCLGHWVTFIILLTSDVPLVEVSKYLFYNFFFTAFVIIGITGLLHWVLLRSYRPVAKAMVERKLRKLKGKS